jgi:hypothetical protein
MTFRYRSSLPLEGLQDEISYLGLGLGDFITQKIRQYYYYLLENRPNLHWRFDVLLAKGRRFLIKKIKDGLHGNPL